MPGTNNYSVRVDVSLNASGVKSGAREMDDAFTQLSRRITTSTQAGFESFGKAGRAALQGVNSELTSLARSVPLIGQPLAGVTRAFLSLQPAVARPTEDVKTLDKTLRGLIDVTGRSKDQLLTFAGTFNRLENDSKKARLVLSEFDGEGLALIPTFEKLGGQLTAVSEGATVAASSLSAAAIGIGAVAAIAVAAGVGIFSLAKSAADASGHLYDLSQRTNISVETLSALKLAIENSGGNLDSFANGLIFFQKNIEAAAEGNKKLQATFKALKVDTKDNESALRSAFVQLSQLTEGTQQTALAQRLFRGSAKDVLGIIKESRGDFDAYAKQLRDLGIIIGTDVARDADKFNDQLKLVDEQIDAVKRNIGAALLPVVTQTLSDISGSLASNKDDWAVWGEGVAETVAKLIKDIKSVNSELQAISDFLDSIAGFHPFSNIGADAIDRAVGLQQRARTDIENTSFASPEYLAWVAAGRPGGTFENRFAQTAKPKGREIDPRLLASQHQARGTDPADEQLRILQSRAQEIDRLARDTTASIEASYRAGLTGLADYTFQAKKIEIERYKETGSLLDAERTQALSKKKGSAAALAEIDKRIAEERSRHNKAIYQLELDQLQTQIDFEKSNGQNLLAISKEIDQRRIEGLRAAADNRTTTYQKAETEVAKIEAQAYLREDTFLKAQQNLYQQDTKQYQDFAYQRALLLEQFVTRQLKSEDAITQSIERDIQRLEEFDQKVKSIDADNDQRRLDIGNSTLDLQSRLGANPAYLRRAQAALNAEAENERFRQEKSQLRLQREKDLEGRAGDQRLQIEQSYQVKSELAEQQHAIRIQEIAFSPLIAYAKKVSELASSVGDVFGRAFADIGQKGKSFFGDLVSGFNQLWQQIVHDFIASRVKNYIESLFNPVAAATQQRSSTGGGGGIISSIIGGIRSLFGGGNSNTALTGGYAGGNPAAAILGGAGSISSLQSLYGLGGSVGVFSAGFGGDLSGGITSPQSITSQVAQQSALGKIFGALGGSSSGGASGSGGGRLSQFFSNPGIQTALLGAGLGAGLGSSLGGTSGLGRVLGGIGGGALGLLGGAFFAQGGFGALAAGTLGLGVLGAATLIGAPLLLAGALILGRNSQRRHDEQIRDQLGTDLRSQLYSLIQQVQTDRIDGQTALAQYATLRANYVSQVAALKDRKTRDHAMQFLTNDLEGQVLPQLRRAIEQQAGRRAISTQLHPTFAEGGAVWRRFADGGAVDAFAGRVPGLYDRRDDKLIRVSGDEVVLTPSQWRPIQPYLKQSRVPGFAVGGSVSPAQQGLAGLPVVNLDITIMQTFGADAGADVIRVAAQTPDGQKAIVGAVRANIASNPSDIPADIAKARKRSRGY